MKTIQLMIVTLIVPFNIFGQAASVAELNQDYLNWYNNDLKIDSNVGTSINKAYRDFLSDKKSKKTVVVAVIDSGVDIDHKDIKDNVWLNSDEIPDNQIDDDGNGYIDDLHGWNFLGNTSGENIAFENMECTRIIKQNNEKDPNYKLAKTIYDDKLKRNNAEIEKINEVINKLKNFKLKIKEETGIEIDSGDDLTKITSENEEVLAAKLALEKTYSRGLESGLLRYKKHLDTYTDYYLNMEYDARNVIGDNPLDINDKNYGNPNVKGLFYSHGTSVAGVIAAIRNNNEGIDGVAADVKIMSIRAIPNGDERDKDVALAIMYAVDNGADIINMSFGKAVSPQKEFVDKAIKYADEKGVLLVHASGNDGVNIDVQEHFPSNTYLDKTKPSNLITIGASNVLLNNKIAAGFSNYGVSSVDLFAPGVNIISLDTNNTYSMHNGTSVAAPVVSGVAALILSYYPEIKPKDLISLLLKSAYKVKKPSKINMPGKSDKKTKFKKLSKSGGIVNAYNALILADKLYK
jgi:subtilisin family serine protease